MYTCNAGIGTLSSIKNYNGRLYMRIIMSTHPPTKLLINFFRDDYIHCFLPIKMNVWVARRRGWRVEFRPASSAAATVLKLSDDDDKRASEWTGKYLIDECNRQIPTCCFSVCANPALASIKSSAGALENTVHSQPSIRQYHTFL